MTSTETAAYVKHHLGLAGRSDRLFTDDAVTLIHTTSRGFPSAVNYVWLQSLVATFAVGKSLVDEKTAQSAVSEALDQGLSDGSRDGPTFRSFRPVWGGEVTQDRKWPKSLSSDRLLHLSPPVIQAKGINATRSFCAEGWDTAT
ncbi:hypothetical protein [Streptomyces sp. NPDC002205]|uniref:hypothetical protein n=1 Tax=Streptomyces sp. NPDC002205 TaxID=3154411 RepID=UPI00331B82F0